VGAALIGHCRAKTVGEVSRGNAHPFDMPDRQIIGVHNGTLTNQHRLDGYKHGMTDSEALYRHMSINGAEQTFADVDGAFACVWWDGQEQTLNFIRNGLRTLYIALSEDRRKILWASEPWMFHVYTRRSSGSLLKDKAGNWFWPLEEYALSSLRINPTGKAGEVLTWAPSRKIVPKPKTYAGYNYAETGRNGGGAAASNFHGFQSDQWEKDPTTGALVRKGSAAASNIGNASAPFGAAATKALEKRMEAAKTTSTGSPASSTPAAHTVTTPSEPSQRRSVLTLPGTKQDGFASTETPRFLLNPINKNSPSETISESSSTPSTDTGTTKPTESTTLSNITTLSSPNMTSRRSSSGSATTHGKNVLPLFPSNKQSKTARIQPQGLVGFRNLAGLDFITDNRTGEEYEVSSLIQEAGNSCALCHVPIKQGRDIGAILNEKTVLCVECANESSNNSVMIN
jgi:hypothetical protein